MSKMNYEACEKVREALSMILETLADLDEVNYNSACISLYRNLMLEDSEFKSILHRGKALFEAMELIDAISKVFPSEGKASDTKIN